MKKAFILLFMLSIVGLAIAIYAETIPTKGYVNPDIGLYVRKEPNSNSAQIGILSKGDTVVIDSVTSSGWYKISSPMKGYVYGQHITVTESTESEEIDESKLTPEEANKIGCDFDKSLKPVKILKAPSAKTVK